MPSHKNLDKLVNIIAALRAPNGCPWDLEQTHKTLKPYVIEETYEVLEAIDENNPELLKEELGDLLLQIILHAQIAKDNGDFDIEDVAQMISEKMVRRHPHVFGDVEAKDADAVKKNWEEIKKKEKEANGIVHESILDGIPNNLPALFESHKISKKVAKQGFDWQKPSDVFEKIDEEIAEVKNAIKKADQDHLEEELGDLLFAITNLCRLHKINPEIALKNANKKFRQRFYKMEQVIEKENKTFQDLSFEDWDNLWEKIK